jgi:hypothetical protein
LFDFEPPATEDEIRVSALQHVRKLYRFSRSSRGNEAAFEAGKARAKSFDRFAK